MQIRTDMAIEAFGAQGVPGVKVSCSENEGISVTEVRITDGEAAEKAGKPQGNYVTLESNMLRHRDADARMAMSQVIAEEISRMTEDVGDGTVMVVGLGNRMVTPDSLGPLTVDRILVTRHIFTRMNGFADDALRSVCAVAPGVMGVTGIETAEMLENIIRGVRPSCVICVDALSARALSRIGCAVQISDTGLQPGSGVGNHRMRLDRDTLGVKVIAVGMPTVIYAATLARDIIPESDKKTEKILEKELKDVVGGDMIVTPREIDDVIKDSAGMIAMGINRALQKNMSDDEIMAMMN